MATVAAAGSAAATAACRLFIPLLAALAAASGEMPSLPTEVLARLPLKSDGRDGSFPCLAVSGFERTDVVTSSAAAAGINILYDEHEPDLTRSCLMVLTPASFRAWSSPNEATATLVVADEEEISDLAAVIGDQDIRADSTLHVVNGATLDTVRVLRRGSGTNSGTLPCGILGVGGCDLSQETGRKAVPNLWGADVTAIYDEWPPYCRLPSRDGARPEGLFPEVFLSMGVSLNFTPVFVPNPDPGVWGSGNGQRGAVPAVRDGRVDTGVLGVSVTSERASAVDFTMAAVLANTAAFARKPNGDGEVSMGAYTSEFKLEIWLALFATGAISFVVFTYIVSRYRKVSGHATDLKDAASESLQLVLRAAASKPTTLSNAANHSLAARAALFSIVLGEFVVFIAFRSGMNAFLSAKVVKMPAASLAEADSQGMGLIMWKEGFVEGYLLARERDLGGVALHANALKDHRISYMSSTRQGVETLLSSPDPLVLFEYVESINLLRSEHPCDILQLPVPMPSTRLAFPFKKGSPLTAAFSRGLTLMDERGLLERIRLRSSVVGAGAVLMGAGTAFTSPEAEACAEEDRNKQVPLGLEQTFLPFLLFGGLVIASLVVLIAEAATPKANLKSKNSSKLYHRQKIQLVHPFGLSSLLASIASLADNDKLSESDRIAAIAKLLDAIDRQTRDKIDCKIDRSE